GARVAILDSGVDCTHPDLTPNLLLELNASFVPGEGACTTIEDEFNHGTHVAGTVAAADNGLGTIGVAPEAEIFGVKVLSEFTGSGSFAGILQGIVYAADADADIINMSLGVPGGLPITKDTKELVRAVTRAVMYARRHNALVIASAGNDALNFDDARDEDGNRLMAFPGGVQGVVGVSATAPIGWALDPNNTFLDNIASYSSHGRAVVDVAAPGGDFIYPGDEFCVVAGIRAPCWVFDLVLSTIPGGWSWSAGTSMAAPHAAGVAALIVGANGGGEMPAAVLQSALGRGADDLGDRGFDEFYGRGRVNAEESAD
ncbi:MAG: S8 family serine peptidase, partial [Pseudomonadota bacterium]|nr:S8 family serine peptidase [Pseudomonadota bacterium]